MMTSHRVTESKELLLCKWEPENSNISDNSGKRVIEELIRGRGLTTQLQAIIRDDSSCSSSDDHNTCSSSSSSDLVMKILDSLNQAISILKTSSSEIRDHHLLGAAAAAAAAAVASIHEEAPPKSEDSSESCKTTPVLKARRGCYKRRKTSETMTRETPNLVEDGHSWRKYGQKFILNTKHPRNYFRCTHKYDQNCQATKQVQKVEDEPPRYVTTYYGRHTCQSLLKVAPQIILDSLDDHQHAAAPHNDSSILLNFANLTSIRSNNSQSLSFNNNNNSFGVGPPPPASSSSSSFIPSPSSVKQEIMQENQSLLGHYKPALLLSSRLDDDEECCDFLPSFDDGDVISGGVYSSSTPSPHSCLDMEDIMASVPLGFDDVLPFEF